MCKSSSATGYPRQPLQHRCPPSCLCFKPMRSLAAGPGASRFSSATAAFGALNDLGELLDPAVVILLIGERPGLATSESLSAYMAFRPRHGDDDSRRNLISNIHARGVPPDQAAPRIVCLAEQLMRLENSGVAVKEEWTGSIRFRNHPVARKEIKGLGSKLDT